ncbi:class I SAM-dependent methyltransferase [Nocardiopsis gilva]|uniref:class I SAM-dependent methyltransferase n=1 Tax=Nocardiopsis gilva TaxID=280236 RepID=UPI001E4BBF18|nr:class I SAM-dependent methyltransferase [Nocardiopsis gilva]
MGAGTGISSRALRAAFGPEPEIVGVEPGTGMRTTAESEHGPGGPREAMDIRFREGTAESLPAANGTASLVMAAQAAHWFDRPAFYAEAVRALRPGGALALMANDKDWDRSALVDDYETFLERHGDGYSRHYRAIDFAGELDRVDGLGDADDSATPWVRTLDPDAFIGLAMSTTMMRPVVRRLGHERTSAELRALLERHGAADRVEIPYVTRLYLRRRRH